MPAKKQTPAKTSINERKPQEAGKTSFVSTGEGDTPDIPDHLRKSPEAIKPEDKNIPIQMLYSASPGLMLTLRPAPRYPTPVRDAETGQVTQVTFPSIKVKFTEDAFVPKKMVAEGSGAKIIYKDLRNCGKFDFDAWFKKNRLHLNLADSDRDDLWGRIVTGPGFGKNFGTLEMIEALWWGVEPKSKAGDKVTVIDTTAA